MRLSGTDRRSVPTQAAGSAATGLSDADAVTLPHPGAALIDPIAGRELSGSALIAAVDAAADRYAELPAGPVFALTRTDVDSVVRYLGAVQARRPVALIDAGLSPEMLGDLIDRYRPGVITGVAGRTQDRLTPYDVRECAVLGPLWAGPDGAETHPDLALLLATSGSTGNPRLVRLSRHALFRNVASVVAALGIDATETTVTSLPLFYTYGLMVLNTHLAAGGTVLLDPRGLLDAGFWRTAADRRITSLATVPYQCEMLRRIGFDPQTVPTLRTLTQAGGRLRSDLVVDFSARMRTAGGELIVMYGQTEAGRMAVLPPGFLPDAAESAGAAIPGGAFLVDSPDADGTGEIVYTGPNVMMGYADSAADLVRGDDLAGVLPTGDVGRVDERGLLFLSGRIKRFSKVFGVRLNLDDVERMLTGRGPLAAVSGDDRIVIYAEAADDDLRTVIRHDLVKRTGLHSTGFDIRAIDALPLLPNGKIDYQSLSGMER
ncbi:acyl-CoA synthetase (AMP-forming)/AMP-acid ligase II [Catenuloplanes nepalensis]|uniref:Acyl-CoA synthetase (AMP-forming)/AMP-acid ligase II n=1 Tax=Catenuloplanes nepalensis TaxID=587533 RepID=A0ABT9N274_9ACTN|nr:AMP-binding protein [Catenuloplanes nepalensis]MDP9797794.1 acyl-CoA synthetase (AMP-forming)/AMP-acid ligase II [Catenuloplanes nepalensis]